MEAFVLTQLSVPEIRELFRQELETYFATAGKNPKQPENDDLLTIEEAADFLSLSVPTLYGMTSARTIPFSKPGKRLYFSKAKLTEWVNAGCRKTQSELAQEAPNHLTRKGK